MARKVITTTEYTDDLDGSKAEGTVSFAFDGTSYEIDLSKRNAREFEKTLALYIGHARKVRATRAGRSGSNGAGGKRDLAAIRAWAKANGHSVSERGRVAGTVIHAYDAAH